MEYRNLTRGCDRIPNPDKCFVGIRTCCICLSIKGECLYDKMEKWLG